MTDAAGNYSLSGFGGGAYTVTPTKTAQQCSPPGPNGIFANDASMISQYVVGLITLTPTQQAAAKVSGLPTLSSFEAGLVAQKVVGICIGLNLSGNWVFTPANVPHPGGVTGSLTENYTAYMMGDVNGDWNPAVPSRPSEQVQPNGNPVKVSLPVSGAAAGSEVTIPLRIDELRGRSVDSYQFDIVYDPSVIEPAELAATVANTLSDGLSVVSNSPQPGLLKVAVYGAIPVNGDGVYVDLKFNVVGAAGRVSRLHIEGFRFNDGSDGTSAADGQLTVKKAAGPSIGGVVVGPLGQPIADVSLTFTSTTGRTRHAFADGSGRFEIGGLAAGETYTIRAELHGYRFVSPTVSVSDGATEMIIRAEYDPETDLSIFLPFDRIWYPSRANHGVLGLF